MTIRYQNALSETTTKKLNPKNKGPGERCKPCSEATRTALTFAVPLSVRIWEGDPKPPTQDTCEN